MPISEKPTSMNHTAAQHVTALELEQALADILAAPADGGTLQAVFVRPNEGQRQSLQSAELSPEKGIHGDRWKFHHWRHLPDGSSDPQAQVSLINARLLRFIAGGDEAMALS